jgi:DNA invertase Pin-like site-specific DNA recombinase
MTGTRKKKDIKPPASPAAAAGQRVGYVRVSSSDQNAARQLAGVSVDRVFTDKVSGARADRPALGELRRYAREGDTVVVHSMDRLARDLLDLRSLVDEFTRRGVRVEFVKEALTFSGDDAPMSRLLLSLMGAVAEFERSLIKERQREGIELAKKRGVYKGRKPALTPLQAEEVRRRAAAGEQKTALARELGVSRETIYAALRGI